MTNPWIDTEIPVPFLLNPLKHHRGFIRAFVKYYAMGWPDDRQEVLQHLQMAGRLMMDLYTGDMKVGQVLHELQHMLRQQETLDLAGYQNWIYATKRRFRILEVSDRSRWTMLLAKNAERYVHVHPARGSLRSTRIKALPLKTAILLKLDRRDPLRSSAVDEINTIRALYLDEAPIKDGRDTKNTVRIFHVLFS